MGRQEHLSPEQNRVEWDGRSRGHLEHWIVALNQVNTGAAIRIRYSLMVPLKGKVATRVAFTSRVPARAGLSVAAAAAFPSDQLSWTEVPFSLEMGPCIMGAGRVTGMLDESGTPVAWDLLFSQITDPLRNLPGPCYRPEAPGLRVVTPFPFMLIGGKIQIGDHQFFLNGDPGAVTHLWGAGMHEQWIRFHCGSFIREDGDPLPAYVSGYGLRDRFVGRLLLPPRYFGHLVWNEQHVEIIPASPWKARAEGRWTWKGIRAGERVTVVVTADPEEWAGDEYPEPDGRVCRVRHSERADCELRFENDARMVQVFRSAAMAHVELGLRSGQRWY